MNGAPEFPNRSSMTAVGARRASQVRGVLLVSAGLLPIAAAGTDYLWTANDSDWGSGTVSKIAVTPFASGAKYRETARYASVTCLSDPANGSKEGAIYGSTVPANLCADGTNGCCTRAETVPGANGLHQPVNLYENRPIRTAVDLNGDTWVLNSGDGDGPLATHQSSITLIAGSLSECVERNGVPGIQTSADFNGDGIIETDCNDNGIPDDLTDVAAHPCVAGKVQEFFGLDDECILFTVNIGAADDIARALALGSGATSSSPADAWAGIYGNGTFYRIDAATGAIKNSVTLGVHSGMTPHPYGAVIDEFGILWAENIAGDGCPIGCVFYFDTALTSNQDAVALPGSLALSAFNGIAIDGYRGASGLVQQIWFGAYGNYGAYRYRPVRNGGFAALKNGTWALGQVLGTGQTAAARGVAVDTRSPANAWVALDGGAVAKIPADMPDGSNTYSTSTDLFATNETDTRATGVVTGGDVWTVNYASSTLTHFSVDAAGNVTNAGLPDQLNLDDRPFSPENSCVHPQYGLCKPHPDSNGDFTGYAFVNFTYPGIDRIFANGFD